MAMDGALNFLTILEGKLIAEIPAPMMRLVLNIAAEALSDFEMQVDDCDGDYIRYRCPLDSDKRYTNVLSQEEK